MCREHASGYFIIVCQAGGCSCATCRAASTIAFTHVASAADLPRKAPAYAPPPPPAVHNWTGFYIGGHLGAARSKLKTGALVSEAGEPDEITTENDTGLIAGGQLGYNWQAGQWVFGLEGDLGYLGTKTGRSPQEQLLKTYSNQVRVPRRGRLVFAQVNHPRSILKIPQRAFRR
jgi:opacity protein-like surface antigen